MNGVPWILLILLIRVDLNYNTFLMKQFYTSLILIFCLQFGFGQIGFEDRQVTDFTISLQDYLFVDINGDNHMDVIAHGTSTIDWYENTGSNGEFKRKKIITDNLPYISSFNAFDFDSDGDMDIIAISNGDDKLVWYENIDTQGGFGLEQEIALSTNYHQLDIYFKDIDGDNDADMVFGNNNPNQSSNAVFWLENNGGSGDNFTIQHALSESYYFQEIVDIDNDGDLDFYAYHQNGVYWYENQGNGTYSDLQIIFDTNFNGSLRDALLYDIDQDSDLDVIMARGSTPLKVSYVENNGSGSFGTEQIAYQSNSYYQSISLGANDSDNDGDIDIIAAFENNMYRIENLSNGNYSDLIPISYVFRLQSCKTEDIDNDGDADVFVSSNSSTISLFKNVNNTGSYANQIFIAANADEAYEVISADINGDGNLDAVIASYEDGKIAWFEALIGEDYFSEQKVISFAADGAKNVRAADIDGDGDLDVISISGMSSTGDIDRISWYENLDGNGTFGAQNNILQDAYDSPDGLLVFDIDGDGDNDVMTSLSDWPDDDIIIWYENIDGQGSFGNEQIISTEVDGVKKLISADIDGDGDLDVVSTSLSDSKVAWYENLNGQGNFGVQQIIADNVVSGYDMAVGDIDGDSDLDIVYISGGSFDSVFWHENTNGEGVFGPAIIVSDQLGNNGSTAIAIADVDNDGDNDVICSSRDSSGSDEIIWFPNSDGLGDFDLGQIISSGRNYITSIHAADFDNDGDVDFLSSARYGRDIVWHENLGTAYNLIKGIAYLDIDSDGCDELDLKYENLLISTTDDFGNTNSVFTTDDSFSGEYQFLVGDGGHSTFVTSQLPDYYTSTPNSQNSSFTGFGNIDNNIDFCIEPIGTISDVNITIYPSENDPRPGFDTTYQLVYKNIGTIQLSGSITFEFDDSKINFLNASEAPASQTANTLTFDYTNLNPFDIRTIDLEFNIFAPPTTSIDDILVSTATINPVSGDETEEDNLFTQVQTVIGSYDPNDITVLEGGEIFIEDIDKYLHYLIRFQNTGTASAINVRVEHVLDDKLDWTTMQLESLSHTGRVEIANETDVSFIFNGIYLPDSTNDEPNSHGFIAFKIKPKSNVVVGDIISGVADIYFDFNPAIVTNTVNTEIVEPLSVDDFNFNQVKLYPNPSKDYLEVTSNQIIDRLTIVDINGRELNAIEIATTDYSLDVTELSKGVYFLEIQSGASRLTKKFIKN